MAPKSGTSWERDRPHADIANRGTPNPSRKVAHLKLACGMLTSDRKVAGMLTSDRTVAPLTLACGAARATARPVDPLYMCRTCQHPICIVRIHAAENPGSRNSATFLFLGEFTPRKQGPAWDKTLKLPILTFLIERTQLETHVTSSS